MELVRVLSSVEDEINVACFHPSVGGGLIYGTKVNGNWYWILSFRILQLRNIYYDSAVKCRKGSLGFYNAMVCMA